MLPMTWGAWTFMDRFSTKDWNFFRTDAGPSKPLRTSNARLPNSNGWAGFWRQSGQGIRNNGRNFHRLQKDRGVMVASSMRQVDGSAELRITPV